MIKYLEKQNTKILNIKTKVLKIYYIYLILNKSELSIIGKN